MANRFWVLPISGTWDATAGVKWATTSGGLGGAAVPTSSDDVFFDGNSGANTVTFSTGTALSLSFTSYVGTFDQGSAVIGISGSLTLATGLTWSNPGTINLNAASGSFNITSGGFTFPFSIEQGSSGSSTATYTLQDNTAFAATVPYALTSGTLDLNNKNFTLGRFDSNNSNTRALIMGSGTVTILDSGTSWTIATSTGMTLTPGTSTIKYTNSDIAATVFAGGGLTYANLWFARGASTSNITLSGSNTFVELKDTGTAAHSLRFTAATTTTVTTWTVTGSSGNAITLTSTTATDFNLVKSGGGVVSSDWLNIQNSDATPDNTWYAGANSVDNQGATGGTGWIFTVPPSTSHNLSLLGVGK